MASNEESHQEQEEVTKVEVEEKHVTKVEVKGKLVENELNARHNGYEKILGDYEKTMATQEKILNTQSQDLLEVRQNLDTLETAFSDVIQKYEKCKKIIETYKSNEAIFRQSLIASGEGLKKVGEKYESLKAHAKSQIEQCNKENYNLREEYDEEIAKLKAVIRRQEIGINSYQQMLDQKNQECGALAALCDEVTGKRM